MNSRDSHVRHIMLYEFRRKSSATVAARNICEVYPNAVSERVCQMWFKRFRNGDFDLEDKERPGGPSRVYDDVLLATIEDNSKLTSRELADMFDVSHTTICTHLKNIGKHYRAGVWVPRELNDFQLNQRISTCDLLISKHKMLPFLNRLITGDEKWVLYNNVTRGGQWLSPGQAPVPTARPGLHPKKVMLCVWWDIHGIVYFELLNEGQTIDSELYCQQLDRLCMAVKKNRPSLFNRKGVVFHQDNAKPHTSRITRNKLNEIGWEILPHPSYSPDIAPSDYHLFQSLQHFLKNKRFDNKQAVEMAINQFFESKDGNFFRSGIECLPQRWQTVVDNNGEYIID